MRKTDDKKTGAHRSLDWLVHFQRAVGWLMFDTIFGGVLCVGMLIVIGLFVVWCVACGVGLCSPY